MPIRLLHGPDCSEHNGSVDFAALAKENNWVSPRINDGDHIDHLWRPQRVAEIRAEPLHWQPYSFARVASSGNGHRSGAAECEMILTFAKACGWGRKGDLPIVYDFENSNGQSTLICARHLMEFVTAYILKTSHHPFIYTMPGFWNTILPHLNDAQLGVIELCPLWIASWGVSTPQNLVPWGKGQTFMHQYTDNGHAKGVSGACDMNRARVGLRRFNRRRLREHV